MSDNMDMRVIKTRAALTESLLELLNKQSFDTIKVVDICEKALVHRTTFYKHFEDKYQLLNYVLNGIIDNITSSIEPADSFKKPEDFYASLLKAFINHISENKKTFRLVIKNNTTGFFMNNMREIVSSHILDYLKALDKKGHKFKAPLPIIANYKGGGFVSVICYLLENEDAYNTDEVYSYLMTLLF